MDVCLLRVLCVVRKRSLRRADHSSRGVLPTVCVVEFDLKNLMNEEAMAHCGAVWLPNKKIFITENLCWLHISATIKPFKAVHSYI